jgi:hypothetical protein
MRGFFEVCLWTRPSGRDSSPANARINTLSESSAPVFNVTHAHREIDHCVVPSFYAAPGVKAVGRKDMAVQPLTAMKSKYNETPEGDNGSGAGLVSRAQIPLTLNPRKKGFTRILPTLADTTSRPAGHAPRRRTHWRKKQGADAHNKIHKKNSTKHIKDNQHRIRRGRWLVLKSPEPLQDVLCLDD